MRMSESANENGSQTKRGAGIVRNVLVNCRIVTVSLVEQAIERFLRVWRERSLCRKTGTFLGSWSTEVKWLVYKSTRVLGTVE